MKGREIVKLVVSDADGTLLSRSKISYPNDFAKMLGNLHKCNIPFVIASGRSLRSLLSIFSKFSDRLVFAALDGSIIFAGRTVLAEFPIDLNVLSTAVKLADRVNAIEFCTAHRSYLLSNRSTIIESEKRRLLDEYAPFDGLPKENVDKIILFTREDVSIAGLKRVYRGENVSEYVRADVDKSTAVRLLCSELGVDRHDVMAFGDSENDRALLEFAGHPVTIYGAKHDIFALSDKHTANPSAYVINFLKGLGKESAFNG